MFRILSLLLLFTGILAAEPLQAQNPKPKARGQKAPASATGAPKNRGEGALKLQKTSVTEGLEVYLPANFKALSDDDIATRFPRSWKKPVAIYSDPQGNTDFTVTERRSDFPAKDLEMLQKFYKASILNMFSEVQFLSEKIERINGRDFVVMEFLSSVQYEDKDMQMMKPIRKYNYLMYTVDDAVRKMVIFSLQAPLQQRSTWESTAANIMASVKLKQVDPKTVEPAPAKGIKKPAKEQPKEQTKSTTLQSGEKK